MAAKTSNRVHMPNRWIRQEYKSNKDKFEKPFEISLEKDVAISLEQSYSALGTTVWDGSIVLAKMFENNLLFPQSYLKKCRVLELGAGCGLVGITITLLGAKHVVLSDLELCLPTLRRNVDRNIFGRDKDCIQVVPFVWGQNASSLTATGKFDIIVAAEVLYDEDDSKLLAESAVQLIAQPGGIMYVSLGRNRKGESSFVKAMNGHGYSVNEVNEIWENIQVIEVQCSLST